MRKMLWIALLAALLVLLPVCAAADTRIMVASDLHYLAPSLHQGSDLFMRTISRGDGKMTHYSAELLRALMDEARAQRPDALLLTGDLTFNGERLSHEELAAAMGTLWDEGIPVYVIPGNHDINNPYARVYLEGAYGPAEAVDPQAFADIWKRCMLPPEAASSMSYTVRLNDRVWIAMADVAVYEESFEVYGFYSEDHQNWLVPMLAEAKEAGVTVISATHQSVVPHTNYRVGSYSVYNREYMQADLRAGGVTLNLSGHVHIQHTSEKDGLTDVATGAFSVYNHGYGMVTVGEDGVPRYERVLAADSRLPEGFRAESEAFFSARTVREILDQLTALGVPEAERGAMADYAARFNAAGFVDALDTDDPSWREDPALDLWARYGSRTDMGIRILRTFAPGSAE